MLTPYISLQYLKGVFLQTFKYKLLVAVSKASYPVMAWQEGTESKKVILSLSGDKNTIQWSSTGQTMPALIRTAGQSLVVASWDMSCKYDFSIHCSLIKVTVT